MASTPPPFDPNKPFKPVASDEPPPFDPKAPFIPVGGKGPKDLQAGLEAFGNSASLGYLPQAQAATYPLFEYIGEKITGKNLPDDTYVQRRDENIKRHAQQAIESPTEVAIGGVTGAIAGSALIPAGKLVSAKGFWPSWKAGTIGRGAQAALVGAGVGAIANPGDTEGQVNPLQIPERIENAQTGALTGAIVQGGSEGVGRAIKTAVNLPATLKDYAEQRAFKATGANKRDYIKAMGKERVNEIGRVLIDEGIVKPGATLEDVAEAVKALKKERGERIGKILDDISEIEAKSGGATVSRKDIGQGLRDDLLRSPDLPGVEKLNHKYEGLIKEFEANPNNLSIDDLRDLKKKIGGTSDKNGLINWDRLPGADIPDEEKLFRALHARVTNALEVRAEELAKSGGLTKYLDEKKVYGSAAEAEKITSKALAGQKANRWLSPTDYFAGGTGAIIGAATGDDLESRVKNAAIGASLGAINKAGRLYGSPILTGLADKTSKILSRNPELLGAYAKPLIEASKKGPAAYGVTLYNLTKDPRFVATVEQNGETNFSSESPRQNEAIQRRLNLSK
jgi:hypothetical protein